MEQGYVTGVSETLIPHCAARKVEKPRLPPAHSPFDIPLQVHMYAGKAAAGMDLSSDALRSSHRVCPRHNYMMRAPGLVLVAAYLAACHIPCRVRG